MLMILAETTRVDLFNIFLYNLCLPFKSKMSSYAMRLLRNVNTTLQHKNVSTELQIQATTRLFLM